MSLWLDASDPNTLFADAAQMVRLSTLGTPITITDKSSSGHHYGFPDPVASGISTFWNCFPTRLLNGRPVLTLNTTTGSPQSTPNPVSGASEYTLVAIFRHDAGATLADAHPLNVGANSFFGLNNWIERIGYNNAQGILLLARLCKQWLGSNLSEPLGAGHRRGGSFGPLRGLPSRGLNTHVSAAGAHG